MSINDDAVAITGLGVVSGFGAGWEPFWHGVSSGASAIRPYGEAQAAPPHLAAALPESVSAVLAGGPRLRRADRVSRMVVTAGQLALGDARLEARDTLPERVAVVVGSALGNVNESVHYLGRLFTKGPGLASPMMFPNLVLNAPASYTAMELGALGANLTVTQGEVSGEHALTTGYDLIRSGRADVVLAGGVDELADILISTYRQFGALSGQRGGMEWSSPYDAERNGVVLGEGAGLLVLEPVRRARQRGATIYAVFEDYLNFGVPAPAYDWPADSGAAPAQLQAFLARAAGEPIDLVCGGANSARRLDAWELDVLARVFGESAAEVTLTSIRSATGQFGAAGVLSAAATSLALHTGVVPALPNLRKPLADVPFRFVTEASAPRALRRSLMFSTARGGASVALLFAHPES